MRAVLFCLAMSFTAAAFADALADADRALAAKAYPAALQAYGKLAQAGNAQAQLRLGEMYWYGEGVALDRAKGDALFAQAAAGGNPEAIKAQSLSASRAKHGADIAYWSTGYDGADLVAGKYNCAAPAIPAVSKTNVEIKATNAAIAAWHACHNGFVDNLNAALPPGKRIPEDIAVLMSEQELQQSKQHLSKIYGMLMDKAQAGAEKTLAARAQWETATVAAVGEQNKANAKLTKQLETEAQQQARFRNDTAGDRPNSRTYSQGK